MSMSIGDRFRFIGLGVAWAVLGLVCAFWTIDAAGDDFFVFMAGAVIHIAFYVGTGFLIFVGGAWFLDEGADDLGEWWVTRKNRGGGTFK